MNKYTDIAAALCKIYMWDVMDLTVWLLNAPLSLLLMRSNVINQSQSKVLINSMILYHFNLNDKLKTTNRSLKSAGGLSS